MNAQNVLEEQMQKEEPNLHSITKNLQYLKMKYSTNPLSQECMRSNSGGTEI